MATGGARNGGVVLRRTHETTASGPSGHLRLSALSASCGTASVRALRGLDGVDRSNLRCSRFDACAEKVSETSWGPNRLELPGRRRPGPAVVTSLGAEAPGARSWGGRRRESAVPWRRPSLRSCRRHGTACAEILASSEHTALDFAWNRAGTRARSPSTIWGRFGGVEFGEMSVCKGLGAAGIPS